MVEVIFGMLEFYPIQRAMPLDHYVSQVHLKNFYSPKLGEAMYAIRKSEIKIFTQNARAVCRIEDGNTNSYLRENRAVEEFLKEIEPKYNTALASLAANKIDQECISVIAGFVAYVLTCSPAGMRIQSNPLRGQVEEVGRRLDALGQLPLAPPSLGRKSLTQLLQSGEVSTNIDPKFPQAMGIASIRSYMTAFANFDWDILINPFADSSFFTSDFPVAIEETPDKSIFNRVVPLAPNLAIRIRPDASRNLEDTSFAASKHNIRKLSRQEVISVNRLIVRCAETMVFFRDNLEWVPKFVMANAGFRIEPRTLPIPDGHGTYLWSTLELTDCHSDDQDLGERSVRMVIKNRTTDRIVGMSRPLPQASKLFALPPRDALLWRYGDYWKFKHLFVDKSLYFRRADQLPDIYEGRFTEANATKHSDMFADAFKDLRLGDSKTIRSIQETNRTRVFLNCWHINQRENLRMWAAYTVSTEAVVVVSNIDALFLATPRECKGSMVRYVGEDEAVPELHSLSPLVHKRRDLYEFENEFRLIYQLPREHSIFLDRPEDFFRLIPVDLVILAHALRFHPAASDEFKAKVHADIGIRPVDDLPQRHCLGRCASPE